MNPITYKITGSDAIRLAERDNLTIYCYANPIDEGGPVHPGVARQIMREDPGLVYIVVEHWGWINEDGNPVSVEDGYNISCYFGEDGEYLGPDDFGIEPRFQDSDPLVAGCQIQIDRSGQGNGWKPVYSDEIPWNIREEIEGEIIDGGKDSCEDFVASNGQHYRW